MFTANPVVDVMPKRYGVNLRSLPPIETLQPETLKDFTKEDLRCYLEAAGLTPGITKPEMKRQMRSLINQLNGVEDNGGSLPNFAEGDIQCADCPKKGNKECHYKRCRTCCLRKMKDMGYRCGPHLRDSDRRPTKITNFVGTQPGTPTPTYHPFDKKTATPPPPITRSSTMPPPPPRYPPAPSLPTLSPLSSLPLPPTPSTVVSPIQPVPTSSVSVPHPHPHPLPPPPLPSISSNTTPIPPPSSFSSSFSSFSASAAPSMPPTSAVPTPLPHHQPSFVPSQSTLQLPPPMEPGEVSPYSVAECPRCHKVVSILGANLWLHLKDCDPDHIMDYVRLLHEGKLSTPTLSEKEKADPIRIAHQNAVQRYQQNITYLQEIFSSTSVEDLIEWHAKMPSREEEQHRAVDTFTKAMEKMTGILTRSDDFLETFQARSTAFYHHLQLLDSCTTLDEISAHAKELERELNLRMEAEPALVRVPVDAAQRRNADASARDAEKEGENGKHVYDKEMVDVSETPPLSLVAL